MQTFDNDAEPRVTNAEPTYRGLARAAWPIMLSNATVPLLGLVDTFVIGHQGNTVELGAIALGSLVFNLGFWTFGFLRMSTTGFVAQAHGAGDSREVGETFVRAMGVAIAIGVALVSLQLPLTNLALWLLSGSDDVEAVTRTYVLTRIWAAPATLCSFVILGTLIGLGRGRALLLLQVLQNGLNATLDALFAGPLQMGPFGIALGTAITEIAVAVLGGAWLMKELGLFGVARAFWKSVTLFDAKKWMRLLQANRDIMIRTLMLLLGFAWFTEQGTRLGDRTLAANHVLLQFISLSAFFLDGIAFVTESLVGKALGARSRSHFDVVVRKSSVLAFWTAAGLALGVYLVGDLALELMTDLAPVRESAGPSLPFVALYVLVAVAAFQLDGIFIGATRTLEMRNASLLSLAAFLILSIVLVPRYGNTGLWLSFIGFALARGLSLGAYLPSLRRGVSS